MRLLVYLEPTPYIVGLWREVAARSADAAIVFVGHPPTQPWQLDVAALPNATLLSGSLAARLRAFVRLACDPRVRLLHLAGWSGPFLLAGILIASLRRVPLSVESDTQAPRQEPRYRAVAKRLLFPLLFSLVDRFFPGGTRQAAYLRRYGVAESRIDIAHMTVDVAGITRFVEAFAPDARRALRQRFGAERAALVLYVGRLEPYKGIRELLAAFERLQPDARLLIAGSGSLLPVVEAASAQDPRIHGIGHVSGDRLLELYAAADMLVVPSLTEPWGLVVNEGMAAGLPVITTDAVGCVDDLVREGFTGHVVAAGDVAALASTISALVEDAPARARMGAAARELISEWTLAREAGVLIEGWTEMETAHA